MLAHKLKPKHLSILLFILALFFIDLYNNYWTCSQTKVEHNTILKTDCSCQEAEPILPNKEAHDKEDDFFHKLSS